MHICLIDLKSYIICRWLSATLVDFYINVVALSVCLSSQCFIIVITLSTCPCNICMCRQQQPNFSSLIAQFLFHCVSQFVGLDCIQGIKLDRCFFLDNSFDMFWQVIFVLTARLLG